MRSSLGSLGMLLYLQSLQVKVGCLVWYPSAAHTGLWFLSVFFHCYLEAVGQAEVWKFKRLRLGKLWKKVTTFKVQSSLAVLSTLTQFIYSVKKLYRTFREHSNLIRNTLKGASPFSLRGEQPLPHKRFIVLLPQSGPYLGVLVISYNVHIICI